MNERMKGVTNTLQAIVTQDHFNVLGCKHYTVTARSCRLAEMYMRRFYNITLDLLYHVTLAANQMCCMQLRQ